MGPGRQDRRVGATLGPSFTVLRFTLTSHTPPYFHPVPAVVDGEPIRGDWRPTPVSCVVVQSPRAVGHLLSSVTHDPSPTAPLLPGSLAVGPSRGPPDGNGNGPLQGKLRRKVRGANNSERDLKVTNCFRSIIDGSLSDPPRTGDVDVTDGVSVDTK